MPRARKAPASRARRKKTLSRAKGFVGGRGTLFRTAHETVQRAMAYATRDRKVRKREFRRLWNVRINAACRQYGMKYSLLIAGLKKAKVGLDRKSLADIAVKDIEAFRKIMELVKQ